MSGKANDEIRARRPYARIGWLATTPVLAAALVLSSWTNYRGAVAAASTVTRGQSSLLEAALRPIGALAASNPPALVLDSIRAFLAAQAGAGVRYVALMNPDGSIPASAGTPAARPGLPPRDSTRMPAPVTMDVGDRVRVYFVRPLPWPDFDPARRVPRPPPPESGPRRPRSFHYTLVEFEPLLARGLVNRAERTLLLSWVGAGIGTLAALLFWRISRQFERTRLQFEEQRRLSQLGEMSAVLAHEIRNPLASLKGNAQLLAEKLPADSRERERADRVIVEATRLEALTSDLLDFARTGPIEMTTEDPREVLRTALSDVADEGFELDVAGAPDRWRLDRNRVRHALVNVLQNARQASPEGAHPRVRVGAEAGRLVFEVRDFGPGLPESGAERIFDPFFTTRTNGTGLGLAVARRVAELHGGRITARNHPDGGAVFRIELPQIKS